MSEIKPDRMGPVAAGFLALLSAVAFMNILAGDWGDALDGVSIVVICFLWDRETRRANAWESAYRARWQG